MPQVVSLVDLDSTMSMLGQPERNRQSDQVTYTVPAAWAAADGSGLSRSDPARDRLAAEPGVAAARRECRAPTSAEPVATVTGLLQVRPPSVEPLMPRDEIIQTLSLAADAKGLGAGNRTLAVPGSCGARSVQMRLIAASQAWICVVPFIGWISKVSAVIDSTAQPSLNAARSSSARTRRGPQVPGCRSLKHMR